VASFPSFAETLFAKAVLGLFNCMVSLIDCQTCSLIDRQTCSPFIVLGLIWWRGEKQVEKCLKGHPRSSRKTQESRGEFFQQFFNT
jgi:hypothetical protein